MMAPIELTDAAALAREWVEALAAGEAGRPWALAAELLAAYETDHPVAPFRTGSSEETAFATVRRVLAESREPEADS